MAVHFLVFLPISSRNSIQEYQIHYSKWDKYIQNVLQHWDDFQLFSESHNLTGCADSLLLLPRPPFVYKGFATTAPQQRHFLQRAHGLSEPVWCTQDRYGSVINTGSVTDDCFSSLPPTAAWPTCCPTATYRKTTNSKTVEISGLGNRLLKTRWFPRWFLWTIKGNHRLTSSGFFSFGPRITASDSY